MEPRNGNRGSRHSQRDGRPRRGAATGLASAIPPGSENGARSRRSPRNLGGPVAFSAITRREVPGDQLQARGRRIRRPRERNADATEIPPIEGNEVRREGWRGFGASSSTCEAGEPTLGTPRREGGAGPRDRRRERCQGLRALIPSQREDGG